MTSYWSVGVLHDLGGLVPFWGQMSQSGLWGGLPVGISQGNRVGPVGSGPVRCGIGGWRLGGVLCSFRLKAPGPLVSRSTGPQMSWYQQAWLARAVLPAGCCAVVAWIALVRRFAGRGWLCGTRWSLVLALAVVGLLSGVAVATGFLLPQLAHLPPAAVGLAAGAGIAPRGRQQGESTQPVVKFMTLGVAALLERLEVRLQLDCADWTDGFLECFKESQQLQIFAHDVRMYLQNRHTGDKALLKDIEEHYQEALKAFDHVLNVETRIDQDRRIATPDGIPEQRRSRTAAEETLIRQALGEAAQRCKQLMRLAYLQGRRSERPALERLRDAALHPALVPRPAVVARRWRPRSRAGRR